MSVTGIEEVTLRLKATLEEAAGPKTEAAITQMQIVALGYADQMTPVITSNLVNSRYRRIITRTETRMVGEFGYGAEYAAAVHNAPGTLKGKPRSSVDPFEAYANNPDRPTRTAFADDRGNFWDPDGEPKFLKKGVNRMLRDDANDILLRTMKV